MTEARGKPVDVRGQAEGGAEPRAIRASCGDGQRAEGRVEGREEGGRNPDPRRACSRGLQRGAGDRQAPLGMPTEDMQPKGQYTEAADGGMTGEQAEGDTSETALGVIRA